MIVDDASGIYNIYENVCIVRKSAYDYDHMDADSV
jgi:hypothetical protein